MRLVLASASPRRAELLLAAGFGFDVVRADVDERARIAEPAPDYVRRLAREKSAATWRAVVSSESSVASGFSRTDTLVVLGADTAVVVDGEILGKPRDDR